MNKEIKILASCGTFDTGGIETMLLNLLRAGMKFDAVCDIPDHGVYEDEMNKLGCKTYHLTRRSKNIFKHHREFYKILKDGNYDVVWLNSQNAFFMWLHMRIARKAGVKVIAVHSHNTRDWRSKDKNWLSKHYQKKIYKVADLRLACGENAAEWLYGTTDGVEIIPLPIDVNRFRFSQSDREETRKQLGFTNDEIVLLQVGRFDDVKNQAFSVKVLEYLLKKNENVRLVFAGDGKNLLDVKRLAYKEKVYDKIKFLGNVKDMPRIYSAADILLMPSKYEGFPTVLLEAQAEGLVCYASYEIDHGINVTGNVLFEPVAEHIFWSIMINEYIKQGYRVNKEKAFEKIAGVYDGKRVAEKLQSLFEESVSRAKRGSNSNN